MQPSLLDGPTVAPLIARVEARMRALIGDEAGDALAAIAREHLATGGKRLRARLALAVGAALGSHADQTIAWAAACELAHNATLVHDDLQDGDRLRRGKPTTWARYGMAQAINAGDLMLMLPVASLGPEAVADPSMRAELLDVLAQSMVTVIRGQAEECELMRTHQVDSAAYTSIIRKKTAALFQLPVVGSALLAGYDLVQAQAMGQAFACLGMLFQVQDDVLDLFGEKGREAPGADLCEGKVSALIVAHCRLYPGERDALVALLRQPRDATDSDGVAHFRRRFLAGGALAEVLDELERLRADAQAQVPPPLAPLMAELLARVCQPIAHVCPARAG